MRLFSNSSTLLHYLICFIITASAVILPQETYAIYEGSRNTDFHDGKCDLTNNDTYIKFDPIGPNIDLDWDTSNPSCLAFIGGVGLTMFLAGKLVDKLCSPTNDYGIPKKPGEAAEARFSPSSPQLDSSTTKRLARYSSLCGARSVELATATSATVIACSAGPEVPVCIYAQGQVALATKDQATCCSAYAAYLITVSAAFTALGVIHAKANYAYEEAHVCGDNWYSWQKLDSEGNESADGIWTKVKGKYQQCLRNLFLGETKDNVVSNCSSFDNSRNISNKYYREFLYGGVEFEDTDGCVNPKTWDNERRKKILGYDSDAQRYYMNGPGSPSVFACQRFLASPISKEGSYTADQDHAAMQAAYECCKKRGQNAMCIESRGGTKDVNNKITGKTDSEHKFCNVGDVSCHVGSVNFEIYNSLQAQEYICAKSYNVCPYNHLTGGGTENADRDSKGNLKNFCQYLNHCSKKPLLPYVRSSSLTSAYIDSSCRDLKGDTQNVFGYDSELLPIKTTGFTAPIVQCVKETMQNMFLNTAGYTKCTNSDEVPDQYNRCVSGEVFQKGSELKDRPSFFEKIRSRFQILVRIVLTLSIIMYGAMLLFAAPNSVVERKKLLPYVLKIALVTYFTLGNAWQAVFVKDVLGASGYLAALSFKPDNTTLETNKLDGCQFPRFDYRATAESIEKYYPSDDSLLSYPPGKEYLQVWDALDCKISRALGLAPNSSIPNLIFMILGGFLTAGFGIVFVVIAFSFAFFMIFLAIRALQFFLVAMLSVVLLLYFSTFIIPLCLFEITKNIFDSWWKQLLSFTLQPMILFAYLGVLIAIFDNVVMGSATFSPTTVEINGTKKVDDYGRIAPKTISCNSSAENDSVYCIFRVADIKTYNGLEALGIGLPILTSVNAEKLLSLAKAALIMFIFSKFMDKVNEIASELTNGTEISTGWENAAAPSKMGEEMYNKLRGVQKRGMRALKGAVRGGVGAASGIANALGSSKSKKKGAQGPSSEDEAGNRKDGEQSAGDEVGNRKAGDEVGNRKDGEQSAGDEVSNRKDGEQSAGDEAGNKNEEGGGTGNTESGGTGNTEGGGTGGEEVKNETDTPQNKDDQGGGSGGEEGGGSGGEENKNDEDKKPQEEAKEETKTAEPEKAAEESKPAEAEKAAEPEKAAEAEKPAEAAKAAEESKSAEAAKAAESTKPAEAKSSAATPSNPAQAAKKSAGSSQPNYMKGTESSKSRNAATSAKFGVNASAPSSLEKPEAGGASANSAAGGNSSGKSSQPKSSVKSNKKSSGGSKPSGGTPGYMKDTASSAAKKTEAKGKSSGKSESKKAESSSSSSSSKAEESQSSSPKPEAAAPANQSVAAPEASAPAAEPSSAGSNRDDGPSSNETESSDNSSNEGSASGSGGGSSSGSDEGSTSSEDSSSAEGSASGADEESSSSEQSSPSTKSGSTAKTTKSSVNHPMPNRNQTSRVGQSTTATKAHSKAGQEIRSSIKANRSTPAKAAKASSEKSGKKYDDVKGKGVQTPTVSSDAKKVNRSTVNASKSKK